MCSSPNDPPETSVKRLRTLTASPSPLRDPCVILSFATDDMEHAPICERISNSIASAKRPHPLPSCWEDIIFPL